ncbi:MAG: trehalose-6-phosphate synthase [Chloroflexi bacterium]|nr:trehalose-6-phosphate synthase [Chloroflexota bacterium]
MNVGASEPAPFRLVIVSNRGPYHLTEVNGEMKYEKTIGGLATAILPVLENSGGVWISGGNPGGRHPNAPGRPPFDLHLIELTDEQVRGFYHGLSNSALWPLCHYFLGRVNYDWSEWQTYEQVNRRFAQVALEDAHANDVIWVHDYHLARAPYYIRAERPNARLAFFWHIPFPAPEIFRTLPWRRKFLASLLACNLVGFHIPEYVKNFKEVAVELLGAEVKGDLVYCNGHATQVAALPIGIDDAAIDRQARQPRVERRMERLRESLRGQTLILGVERMDYTKGILERLRGMEHLLKTKPEIHGKVTLIQIVTPSREGVAAYREKKREIDEIVGRINGRFSNDLWTPIHYLYRAFTPSRLVVYYRAADIALVTPLRDGLNLIAKEYVAARIHQDGVLILSEFAGVTCQLPEALSVNPYDIEDMAAVIEQALVMPKEEQRRRIQAMQARIKAENVTWWMNAFLDKMANL